VRILLLGRSASHVEQLSARTPASPSSSSRRPRGRGRGLVLSRESQSTGASLPASCATGGSGGGAGSSPPMLLPPAPQLPPPAPELDPVVPEPELSAKPPSACCELLHAPSSAPAVMVDSSVPASPTRTCFFMRRPSDGEAKIEGVSNRCARTIGARNTGARASPTMTPVRPVMVAVILAQSAE
jgi:hypothetical protein